MRKATAFGAALALLLVSIGTLRADAPELAGGVYIMDGNIPLEVDRHSSPSVVDWNNDGAKDLVIGQYGYGYVQLYLNQGTDLNPLFNGGGYIYSGGSPIMANYG